MTGTTLLLVGVPRQATSSGIVRDGIDLEPVAFARTTVAATDGEATPAAVASDRFGAFVVPNAPTDRPVRVEVEALGHGLLGVTLGAAYTRGLRDMESGGGEARFRTATLRGGFVYWIR